MTIATEEAYLSVLPGARVSIIASLACARIAAAAFPQGICAPLWASVRCCERQLLPSSKRQVPMHQQSCPSMTCCHATHSKVAGYHLTMQHKRLTVVFKA
jgi:hypothetical protein